MILNSLYEISDIGDLYIDELWVNYEISAEIKQLFDYSIDSYSRNIYTKNLGFYLFEIYYYNSLIDSNEFIKLIEYTNINPNFIELFNSLIIDYKKVLTRFLPTSINHIPIKINEDYIQKINEFIAKGDQDYFLTKLLIYWSGSGIMYDNKKYKIIKRDATDEILNSHTCYFEIDINFNYPLIESDEPNKENKIYFIIIMELLDEIFNKQGFNSAGG
jgi:hypothetical protein